MNCLCLLPEFTIIGAILALLIIGTLFKGKYTYNIIYLATIATLGTALYFTLQTPDTAQITKLLINDQVLMIKRLLLAASLIVFVISHDLRQRNITIAICEYPVLYMLCILGMLISISAADFLVMYLGLELQALAIYVMTALDRNDLKASESGLRYYILGSMASALMLYGFSMIYGVTGTIRLVDLSVILGATPPNIFVFLFYVTGIIFTIAGLCFKIASFPMYMWVPDVYRGASSTVTTLIATLPKITAFVIMHRLFHLGLSGFTYYNYLYYLIYALGICSMAIGFFGALSQNNVRRFLAYSSIQNAGYVLLLIPAVAKAALQTALIYLFVYTILFVGIIGCILRLSKEDDKLSDLTISDLSGLAHRDKFAAVALAIFLLSMAGIPPMAGFLTKLYLFTVAISEGMYISVIAASLLSVAAMYYYLRIIKIMFFDTEQGDSALIKYTGGKSMFGTLIILLCLMFNLGFLIKPGILSYLIH